MIDLRSDTITKPTPEMRHVIANAEVGDDVFGDDPTVKKLEEKVAEMLGKESAVYMPSGTMTNQVAIRSHTEPGDDVILDKEAHIYYYESGAPAAIAGVMLNFVSGARGVFTGADVESALRPRGNWFPPAKLVCIENTHNRGGGKIWSTDQIADVARTAKKHDLRMHLDGARLWNAAVATGIPEKEYAGFFDSVSVCFSKGLGAPIGSALCGSREFIARARRFRTQFGGGMRQSGLMAAAALYALENHRERLADDHANAKRLATRLQDCPNVGVNASDVETNIMVFEVPDPAPEIADQLYQAGVWVVPVARNKLRAVTHLHISAENVEQAARLIRNVMQKAA